MRRKLRIGFVTPALYWGGAERVLVNLARELKDRVQFTGCALCYPAFRTENMVAEMKKYMPVYPGRASSPLLRYGRPAAEKVARHADVIVCWGEVNPILMLWGFPGPVVFITHGCGEWDKKALAAADNGVTHHVCVSGACLSIMGKREATVIENGVEPERCRITRTRAAVRKELGLSPHDFAVGYLGRMAPEKTPQKIAAALRLLPDVFKGVWIGGGSSQREIRNEIVRLIGPRAILRDTVWDIGNYLQAFDMFALVSPAEGFSMSFLEAALVGVPCVTTPVGIMPELLKRHGPIWATVPINHRPRQLARTIQQIRDRRAQWQTNALQARMVVQRNYLASHMAERWLKYLQEIVP